MEPGRSSNAKSQRRRARLKKQQSQGSPAYMSAVRGTGCVVPRLSTERFHGTDCDGRPTFSHLEKARRPEHHWSRTVCMCFHHHLDEYEGNVEWFCDTYGIPFGELEAEAARLVVEFGHLV